MARTAGRSAPGPGRRLLTVAAMGACLLVLPLALNLYYLIVLSSVLAFAIACLSFNLLFGYTGLLSLGHALDFGLGAHTGFCSRSAM